MTITIAGQTYDSYQGQITQSSDVVMQAEVDGLLDILPDSAALLDGVSYRVDKVIWKPGIPERTRIAARLDIDSHRIASRILSSLDALVAQWITGDPVIARLESLSGGYAALIRNDIGDRTALPDVQRALRRNLFDIRYAAGVPLLLPLWRTTPGKPAVAVIPVGNPEYRRNGSLTAPAVGADEIEAAQQADAKEVAQSIADRLSGIVNGLIMAMQAFSDYIQTEVLPRMITYTTASGVNRSFPQTRPATGYTADDLTEILNIWQRINTAFGLGNYALVNASILRRSNLIVELASLLAQYVPYLGTGYANSLAGLGIANFQRQALLNALDIFGTAYWNLANVADQFRTDANGPSFIVANVRTAHTGINQAITAASAAAAALRTLTANIASVTPAVSSSKIAARYLDANNNESVFPRINPGDTRVVILPDLQPSQALAAVRVQQAERLRDANAGSVQLELPQDAPRIEQYDGVIADLGLPNGVRNYRVAGARVRLDGVQRKVTLDCRALPAEQAPAPPSVTEFGPLVTTPHRWTAEQTGGPLIQPPLVYSIAITRDLTPRAYIELPNGDILVARRGRGAAWSRNDAAIDTDDDDYVYVYGPGQAFPKSILHSAGRKRATASIRTLILRAITARVEFVLPTDLLTYISQYNQAAAAYSFTRTPDGALALVSMFRFSTIDGLGIFTRNIEGVVCAYAPITTSPAYSIGAWSTPVVAYPAASNRRAFATPQSPNANVGNPQWHNIPQILPAPAGAPYNFRVIVPPYSDVRPIVYNLNWTPGAASATMDYEPDCVMDTAWRSNWPTWFVDDDTIACLLPSGTIAMQPKYYPYLVSAGSVPIPEGLTTWQWANAASPFARRIVDKQNRVWTLGEQQASATASIRIR